MRILALAICLFAVPGLGVEPQSEALKPVRWQAGFDGNGLGRHRLAFSPDGKYMAAVGFNVGRVWNTADWSLAGQFKATVDVKAIAFSPSGDSIFVAGGGGRVSAILDRWDWRAAKQTQQYAGHDSTVYSMQLSRDGKWLLTNSVGEDGSTILYDAESGEAIERVDNEGWEDLKLRRDGKQFLATDDRNWFVGETLGKRREKLPFEAIDLAWATDGIWSLEESPEEKASPGTKRDEERTLYLGRPKGNSVLRLRKADGSYAVSHDRPLEFGATNLLVSDAGETVVALNSRRAQIFAGPDWESVGAWTFPQPQKRPILDRLERCNCLISPDSKLLTVATDYAFPKVFETRTGQRVTLGAGHSNQITAVEFVDGSTVRTRDKDGVVLRWNASDGNLLPVRSEDAEWKPAEDEAYSHPRTLHVADDGKTWQFVGQNGGQGDRFKSFEIRLADKGVTIGDIRPARRVTPPGVKVLGEIEVRWGQRRPMGLVPGGEYLYLGTQILSRTDLKPISAVNVQGEIEQMTFSPDGKRYALLVAEYEYESRPATIGPSLRGGDADVRRGKQVAQRLRVHDTRGGETLFALPTESHVRLLALSLDASRVATVNDRQQVEVWEVP